VVSEEGGRVREKGNDLPTWVEVYKLQPKKNSKETSLRTTREARRTDIRPKRKKKGRTGGIKPSTVRGGEVR